MRRKHAQPVSQPALGVLSIVLPTLEARPNICSIRRFTARLLRFWLSDADDPGARAFGAVRMCGPPRSTSQNHKPNREENADGAFGRMLAGYDSRSA